MKFQEFNILKYSLITITLWAGLFEAGYNRGLVRNLKSNVRD